eukprot:3459_1
MSDTGPILSSDTSNDKDGWLKKQRHSFFNLYKATIPLATIFLLDILPSRISLIIIGHITNGDQYAFTSIFLAYSFTNFFSVFVLSLSCGLDTLTKQQLRNISYLRYALILVCIGLIPYILCCVFSENILYGINQPIEIIETSAYAIQYLILYSICYIIFAMLRKSLLQYLHTTLLIGFMFARLCIHLVIGYSLFYYTKLNFYSFLISDSLSMFTLLIVTIITLSRMINLKKFIKNLFTLKLNSQSKAIIEAGGDIQQNINDSESFNLSSLPPNGNNNYFKQYINATLIPGSISCLEWWAVETFTFLVGALTYNNQTSKLTIFFVNACWASLLLIFQMPMLGLSVAMAAIMTADIRASRFYMAWYTFIQAMVSVIIYCVFIGLLVNLGYDKLLNIWYPMNSDTVSPQFINEIKATSASITAYFTVSICGYSIAMCFLGIFVSVGRLARGGTFMLIGYYIVGLILAIILGFVAQWKLQGIWFGEAGAFLIWCLLSALYWSCTNWKNEMKTMKEGYDLMEKKEKNSRHSKVTYGSTDQR